MFLRISHKYMEEADADGAAGGGAGGQENTGGQEDWKQGLGEYAKNPAIESFNSAEALAKGFVDLKSYQGSSLRIPSENASESDRTEFLSKLQTQVPELMLRPNEENMGEVYAMMGRPEEAKGYGTPEEMRVEIPTERMDFLQQTAHKYGLNKEQFEGMIKDITAADADSDVALQASHDKGLADLQKEWGMAYPDRVSAADKVRENFFGFIPKEGLGAEATKAFYTIAKQLGSETLNLVNNRRDNVRSPDEAQNQLNEIMGNRKHPYWNPESNGNTSALALVQKLNEEIYGTSSTGNTQGIGGTQYT